MNKNTIFKSFILLGLISLAPAAFAQSSTDPYQKSSDPYGKTSTPRTTTVPATTVVAPSVGSGTAPTTAVQGTSNTPNDPTANRSNNNDPTTGSTGSDPTVGVPGTNSTGGSDTPTSDSDRDSTNGSTTNSTTNSTDHPAGSTPTVGVPSTTSTGTSTGVQGTSTTPPVLPGTTQVGGTSNTPSSTGANSGEKSNGKNRRKKTPQPAPQSDVEPSVGVAVPATTQTAPITMQDDGRVPVTPSTVTGQGAELTGVKPTEWTQTLGTSNTPAGAPVPVRATSEVGGPSVTGAQTAQQSRVGGKKSCEDDALKEVYKIMSSDSNNAFAKMVELTTMKLAKKALAEGSATLEGYTHTKMTELEGYFKKSKEAGAIHDRVVAAYEAYGKSGDANTINADLNAALAQGKKSCYWSSTTHLWNTQVASYVLAMSAADPKSGLTDSDAATVWALEKIRTASGGSGSLLITNRVARYLGAVQGGKAMTVAKMDAAIAAQQAELNQLLAGARSQAEKSLVACIEQQNPSCADCQAKAKAKLSSMTSNLEQVQRGLAAEVQKSDSAKMISKFKGKAGEIDFDLGNIAQGTVQKDPSRLKGFDACGNAKPASTAVGVGKAPQDCKCTAVAPQCNCAAPVANAAISGSSVPAYGVMKPEYNAMPVDKTDVVPAYGASPAAAKKVLNSMVQTGTSTVTIASAKTQASCVKVGGAWNSKGNQCEKKSTYQSFYERDPVIKGVKEYSIPVAKMVVTYPYKVAVEQAKMVRAVADYTLPKLGEAAIYPYTVAIKSTKTIYQVTKEAMRRNPAAAKSVIENAGNPLYVYSPWGFAYDLQQLSQ